MLTQAPPTAHPTYTPTSDRPDDNSGHAHRQVIGYLGALLPVLLPLTVWLRPGLEDLEWAPSSISAYYWSGAVSLFSGVLAVLSVFLLTYRGYDNEDHKWDRRVAIVAGVAAALVAVFPTEPSQSLQVLHPWWAQWIDWTHKIAAVVLFSMFAVFSLWLFRKGASDDPKKRRRNHIYMVCGVGIIGSMLWAAGNAITDRSVFLPEAAALWFFAWSWLVKGRALRSIEVTVKSAKAKLTKSPAK
jgi:hypothetical protein